MFCNRGFSRVFILLGVCWAFGLCPVSGADWKTLPGHVPRVTSRLTATGRLPATNELRLAIGLPLRDAAGLDQFLAAVANPASPDFRHYLTPEEFSARFGPTAADYATVENFALTNGLQIAATHGNRLVLDVTGSAANVERAFQLHLKKYQHPTEAREFFAPDAEPSVDAALPVTDMQGLSDFIRPHAKLHHADATVTGSGVPKSGSASGGNFLAGDFRNAYVPGTPLTGAGQRVGLLEFDGYYASDIVAYEHLLPGSPQVPVQPVLLDGFSGTPTPGRNSGNDEVSLDIEMVIGMAPGLAQVVVFEAGPNGFQNDILNAMAADTQTKQFSCSWGWGGGPAATTENIFKQMSAQGQSFFNASGDSDAFTTGVNSVNAVDDSSSANAPSSSPNITQVGGTTLTMNGAGNAFASETVWNAGGGTGSSGGISSFYSIPAWQQGTDMSVNGGSPSQRNIPDVAINADNTYVTYGNGRNGIFTGTSIAAPLWAAFLALVNQQAAAAGNSSAGFINPAVYALGQSAGYKLCFHDTTAGDNTWSGSPSEFFAAPGYDLCTGWGTPNGTNLINALAGLGAAGSVADTTPPTVSITSPASNLKWSNAVFTVTGTAADNVAVSNVFYSLNGAGWLPATPANNWASWTANVTLVSGTNTIQAYAEDTSGNLSATQQVKWVCILSAPLTVSTNGRGSISPNDNNALLQIGASYALIATAATGFKFTHWTDANSNVLTNGATLKFLMASNLAFTANFVDILPPTNGISSPTPSQHWSNAVFVVTGKAGDNVGVAEVFYSLNGTTWLPANPANGWSNWTVSVGLTPGTNTVQAYAVDGAGNVSPTNKVSFVYILSAPLTVSTNGRGSISPNYNNALLQIGASYALTATAATGFKFTSWTDANHNVLTNGATLKFLMAANLAFTANFADITPPTLSLTAPLSGEKWSNYLFTVSGKASDNVGVADVFYSLNGAAWLTANPANGWSNWTAQVRLVPGTNTILVCAVDAAGNVSVTNKVSFVFIFALGGWWNTVQFQTPALMAWDPDNGLAGGNNFGETTGTLSFNADGTLSGQSASPFTGAYVQGSNGLISVTIATLGDGNNYNLFVNPSRDLMMQEDAMLNADNNDQELLMFARAPAANTLSSMAGTWNALQFQTPAQMTWDPVNGLAGGGNFTATNGSVVLSANGAASGNLGGAFTGSYQVGSNGVINLTTVAGGLTNTHTLFVNASRSTMVLVESQPDANDNLQQLIIFQLQPASVATNDVAGLWNLAQLQTPAQMAWDAVTGLNGGGNFGAAGSLVNFNVNGTVSDKASGAIAGTYHVGRIGNIRLNLFAGGVTNSATLFMDATKDGMTGVTTGSNNQQLWLLQRPAAN